MTRGRIRRWKTENGKGIFDFRFLILDFLDLEFGIYLELDIGIWKLLKNKLPLLAFPHAHGGGYPLGHPIILIYDLGFRILDLKKLSLCNIRNCIITVPMK